MVSVRMECIAAALAEVETPSREQCHTLDSINRSSGGAQMEKISQTRQVIIATSAGKYAKLLIIVL